MQPLASLKALADPIYEAFYGLTEQPFAITTDPKFLYLSESHQRAYDDLLMGLRRREGLLLLTGETGSGKTTMCRAVIDALGPRTFSALVLNPYMSGAEIFRMILRDFGLVTHEELRRGGLATADVPQMLDMLEGFLQSLMPLNTHAVIVIDEAQTLPPQVLDQIRLLTALERDEYRLVQVILCGQQAILETLKTEPMQATNERITRRVAIEPLTADEIEPYIQHRIAIAGGGESVRFDAAAADVIAELSHGLPRRVNVLCDRALQEGRVEGVSVITAALVKRGARALAGMPAAERAMPGPYTPPANAPMFGGLEPGEARPSLWRLGQAQMAVIGGLATALLFGLLYYVHVTVTSPTVLPNAPSRPVKRVGAPTSALPIPGIDDLVALLTPRPRPATDGSDSGETPNNSH